MTNDPNQEISKQVKPVFRPDCQDDLIKFIDDPETINKAVEGSMDKRAKVLDDSREPPDFLWKVYQEGLDAGFQEAHNKTSKDAGQVKQEAWAALEVYTANKQRQLLEWVEQALPAELDNPPDTIMRIARFNTGYNQAIQQIREQLKNKKESL